MATKKQQDFIEKMRKENALYADVMLSFKDTPEDVRQERVKLRLFDENDPCDEMEDEDIFFYFCGIDELVEAMDAGNKEFEFTISAIVSYEAFKPAYDRNGFEIKRGDTAMCSSEGYFVVGDPNAATVSLEKDGKIIKVNPDDVEVFYHQINVEVTDIVWDTEDGMDGELPSLPVEETISLEDLVDDYGLKVGDKVAEEDAINEYLSDNFNFLVKGYSYAYDRKRISDKEKLIKKIKEAYAENGADLNYCIEEGAWNGSYWYDERGYFTEDGVVRFDDNPSMTIFESYDEIDLDILQECFDAVITEDEPDAPEESVPDGKATNDFEKMAEDLKAKIFNYVKNQKNQAVFFDTNNGPLIPTNDFEDDFFVEVQGLAIFKDCVAVYFGDSDWDEYDFNDDEDVKKILDEEFWQTRPLEDNHPYYFQTIYNIAKYLNL